jgi:NAD(P)-dependent dehydrogenase (short-subunit alcohol dehydrogenase family)
MLAKAMCSLGKSMNRKVAFVTGASRGIGRASALALAESGFDVVVTARTVKEGQSADGRPLPGSIETTADEVRSRGREALAIRLDLLERDTIDAAIEQTLSEWGRIDLLLNNGIYTGSGTMSEFMDLTPERVETMFQANVFSQIWITQRVLPGMLQRGQGSVINMVSGAGLADPPAPVNQGGWGFGYGATKAAFHRMVGVLKVEFENSGVRFYNLEPGFVVTEAMTLNDPNGEIAKRFRGAPPAVPASVVAWLATDPDAERWNGQTVFAQKLCLELHLQPDWRE